MPPDIRFDLPLPRDVVLFSTADWENPYWTNKQRVARQLAQRGFRVLYVESLGLRRPTLGPRDLRRMAGRIRRGLAAPREVEKNLWIASPLAIPWHSSSAARWLNDRWLAAWLRRQCGVLGFARPIVWTYNPLVLRLAQDLAASLLVYHAVDDLSAAPHVASAAILPAEEQLVRAAEVTFTTSPALQSRAVGWNARAAHYLPNVADFDHFSQARLAGDIPPELAAIPHPRIGFVGALSEYKVDFELIGSIARARPDWHWVLIGQVGEGQQETRIDRLRLPNVHLLGPRPYERLPDYLRGFDVATIPCPANPYTAAMFPLKFFEYLAAGLPVVAARVPALAEFANACELVESTADFRAGIERILGGRRPNADHCLRLAEQFTWQWRSDEMLRIVEQAWLTRREQSADHSQPPLLARAG